MAYYFGFAFLASGPPLVLVPPIHCLSRIFDSETDNNDTNIAVIVAENVVESYTSLSEFHFYTRYSQLVEVLSRFCNSHRFFFGVVVVSGLKHFLMTSEMR